MRVLGAALALMLFAGCAESPAASSAAPSATRDPVVTTIDFAVKGTFVAWNAAPNGGDVDVEDNATLILMEARWSCPAGPCELTLYLIPRRGTTESATGTNEGTHSIAEPDAGTWNAQVRPTSATADAEGQIRVTVFYGEVPPGYSAFDKEPATPPPPQPSRFKSPERAS